MAHLRMLPQLDGTRAATNARLTALARPAGQYDVADAVAAIQDHLLEAQTALGVGAADVGRDELAKAEAALTNLKALAS